MSPDWQAPARSVVLFGVLFGTLFCVLFWLGVAAGRLSPTPPVACTPTPYIQVIERDVLRCELGAALQASVDAEGQLIAWCEKKP